MRRKTISHLVHKIILLANYIGSSNVSFGGKLYTFLSNQNENFNIHNNTPNIYQHKFLNKAIKH